MRKDAGTLHGRNEIQEVPLIWAVPLYSSEDIAGEFWAFFPTDTLSRVAGIINAPWKIDFGRSALVPGEYNTALSQCYVTQSSTLAAAALEAAVQAIVLSPSACALWLGRGAQDLESHIQIETSLKAESPVPLTEVVPEFAEVLTDEFRDAAFVRFVGSLALVREAPSHIVLIFAALASPHSDIKIAFAMESVDQI